MKKTLKYILVAVFATMFAAPAFADKDPKDAIKTQKNIIEDANGNLKLRLETFVTGDGENRSQMVTTVNPMDVVLVLDRSGSMDDSRVKLGQATDQGLAEQCYKDQQAMPTIQYWDKTTGTASSNRVSVSINNSGEYVFSRANERYNGNIYVTKIDALKIGVNVFADVVKKNSEENDVEHHISVVSFSDGARTDVALSNDYAMVKSAVNSLKVGGGTDARDGMNQARSELNTNAREGSSRTVVFFTDGEPASHNLALAASLNLKNDGVTVFSIGVFENPTNTIKTFLYFMSSHNTTVSTMPTARNYQPGKYYKLASNADELKDAFEETSKEIGKGSDSQADYVLETSSTVLRDIITPSFQIPEGGKVSFKVSSVKKLETTSISDNADLTSAATWEAERDTTMTNAVVQRVDPATGNTYVDVKGFDFNANWVGYVHKKVNGTETKKWLRGNKLVMYIDIEPSAENEGGAMQTNAEGSGVLINGNEVVPFDQDPIQDYVNNDLVTVRQVNLTIKKSGLQPGESVIYVVTRNNDSIFKRTVALTAGADGTAEGKVKVDAWPNANKSSLYTYTVTEDTTWAYEYKASAAQSHTLYDSSLKLTNVFTFGPSEESGKSSSSASRGEHAKNNVFSR